MYLNFLFSIGTKVSTTFILVFFSHYYDVAGKLTVSEKILKKKNEKKVFSLEPKHIGAVEIFSRE